MILMGGLLASNSVESNSVASNLGGIKQAQSQPFLVQGEYVIYVFMYDKE